MSTYEICVDAEKLLSSFGCAFDIGGTRCKVVYCKEILAARDDGDKQMKLRFATFPVDKVDEAIELVLTDGMPTRKACVLKTCGVSVRGDLKAKLENSFETTVTNLSEFDCLMDGMDNLLTSHSQDSFLLPLPQAAVEYADGHKGVASALFGSEPTPPTDEGALSEGRGIRIDSLYPFLVTSIGTGCCMCKVGSNGSREVVTGSSLSGKTFRGMGFHLAGTNDYHELLELAVRGDEARVTNFMSDLKSNTDGDIYASFADNWPMFNFGKAVDGYQVGKEPGKADLVRALLSTICTSLAQLIFWVASARQCRRVFISGGFVEHATVQEFIAKYFLDEAVCSNSGIQMSFVKPGNYLGCLGAIMSNK